MQKKVYLCRKFIDVKRFLQTAILADKLCLAQGLQVL